MSITVNTNMSSLICQGSLNRATNEMNTALQRMSTGLRINSKASSLIKDADIAKESASYIKNQILQQTTSTLLATANQNPSIALSLV